MAKSKRQKESITVKLSSDNEQVNAAAVGATMTAIVTLIREAHDGMAANEELLVKARPFKKGSFEIPIDLILLSAGALLASSPLLQQIIEIIQRYFEITIRLRGQPPRSPDPSLLVIEGEEINVGSITMNLLSPTSTTSVEMSAAVSEIQQDAAINQLEIRRGSEKRPFVRVRRREFEYFKREEGLAPFEAERDVLSREQLTIRTVPFEGAAKWKFNRRGTIISAKMSDVDFLERVHSGSEAFRSGDRLDVELVVHQKFHSPTQDYMNVSYEIPHVWGHQPRMEQAELFERE